MRVALATCTNLPGWEKDDVPLHEALDASGVRYQLIPWDCPNTNWKNFDGVLIRTTWDYMERVDAFTAWAEAVARTTPLFNPGPVICWNAHKGYLRDLEKGGIPIAPTEWLSKGSVRQLKDIFAERGWRRGFIKPQVGATARLTHRFDRASIDGAQRFLDDVLPEEAMMVQPYIESVETQGEISLIYFDGYLSHAVQKVPVAGDYRVQDDFGARDFPIEPPAGTAQLGENALAFAADKCGLAQTLLYGRVDLLQMDSGVWVLNELELIEPSLFLRHSQTAAPMLAQALRARLSLGRVD